MQLIGSGVHGPQAAVAVRQAAARQGVWSLGNFGGMPPQAAAIVSSSAILPMQQISSQPTPVPPPPPDAIHPTKIDDGDYRSIFNSCGVGIAIASMGGGFVDCNPLFCSVSNYTKQELCAQTIFNLTERQDLQRAFDMICRMLAPSSSSSTTSTTEEPEIVVLRGAMKNRGGVGLGVSLVKGENGIPKCFCVTLVKNPSSSDLDMMKKPIPIACDQIFQQAAAAQSGQVTMEDFSTKNNMAGFAPTFTAG
jgi:PAS domain-containing protein